MFKFKKGHMLYNNEFRKHAKIVFYLTSTDAKTVRSRSWRLDFATKQKALRLPVQKLWLKQ